MLCGLIMAGGKGTRFWPASTEEKPKQFLSLTENRTMIQLTVDRLKKMIPLHQIFIVTGEQYKTLIQQQIPDIPERNIILEPVGRNTAPCILLSCLYIKKIYKETNIAVFPSDHHIKNIEAFEENIMLANSFVESNKETIVTIGIKPTHPEINYGYINYVDSRDKVLKVKCFVEKPNIDTAIRYVNEKSYLWNAGMFIFSNENMINECKKYIPEIYDELKILDKTDLHEFYKILKDVYPKCTSISIDYGVMEKSEHVFVILSSFDWDDVGNWKALERYMQTDDYDNICKGICKIYNSNKNIMYSTEKQIIMLNVDGMYCIETEDKIVIGKVDDIENLHTYRGKL